MKALAGVLVTGGLALFAVLPGTDNYELRSYGFGSGGTSESGTSNYSLEGLAGEISALDVGSDNYGLRSGIFGVQLANLPDVPAFTNDNDWYNKLALVIDTAGNPSDTTFAVAISTDDFVTTQYVQSDDTVGNALGTEDFRDYNSWGSGSGTQIIGLQPDTTYKVKVKARQGDFTETGFGPEASAATSVPSLVFDIDIADTDQESAAPYELEFGQVPPDTITDSPDLIWLDIDSNGESGTMVYVVSQNDGLVSAVTGYTIIPVTGDLGSLQEGVGAQNTFTDQTAGDPLVAEAPYDGAGDNIGAVDNQFRPMLSSTGPLEGGRAAFLLKIKTTAMTPAASDYVDIYTVIASASF